MQKERRENRKLKGEALKESSQWLSASTLVLTACIVFGLALAYAKFTKRHTIKAGLVHTPKNVQRPVADVCYREPVWARVPPKVHWSTCQADWCRPL